MEKQQDSFTACVLSDYTQGEFSPADLEKAASRQGLKLVFRKVGEEHAYKDLWANFAEKLYVTTAEGYDPKEIETIKQIEKTIRSSVKLGAINDIVLVRAPKV